MKIHRLRLEHVKGVTAAEVTFPETGVVVIEGPNEVGKSTLLEALDRLLDPKAKASSKAASITSLQPVGQDVGPYVEAELSIGPYRLVFGKRWLKQSATTLQIVHPTPAQLTGQDAQAKMNAILEECLDRTLFEALRLAQAGSPGALALGKSDVLEAALDAAAGADLHADEGPALLAVVEREYLRYYTAGTGRVTGELREAQAAVTDGEHLHEQSQHDVREVEELLQRREALARDLTTAEEQARTASDTAQAANAALAQVLALRAQEEEEQQTAAVAQESYRRAARDVQARQALADEAAARSAEVQQRQEQTKQLRNERDQRAGELAVCEEGLQRANTDCLTVQHEADVAATDLSHLRSVVELAALADRLETAESLTRGVLRSRGEVEPRAVTGAVLEELRRSDAALNIAQARVEASATVVRVSAPEVGHSVEIDQESPSLDPGHEVIERLVSSDLSLLVDSRVRIEIRPDADARGQVQRRDALHDELSNRLAELGLTGLADAELAAERRSEAVRRTAELERDLARALGGRSLEGLREEYTAQVAALRLELTPSAVAAPEVEQPSSTMTHDAAREVERRGKLQRAEQRAEAARRVVPKAHHLRAQAQQAVDTVRAQHAQSVAALEVMQAQHANAISGEKGALAALAQSREVECDDAVHERARHTETLMSRARQALRETQTALATEGALVREDEANQASAELARASEHVQGIREHVFETRGRLEQVTAEGRQEADERAHQVLADARRRHASVMRRATAAARLYSTLQRHRERAHHSYAEPYARQIERLGQQMYGESFGVTVSHDLVITHRRLHGDIVSFESLSGGAKEQLGILARLAVAALVTEHQSMPVVVDDALGYTDPERLRRLGAVLAEGGNQSQLLLLTCTPDRYADIPGAHTIRMTA